MAIADITKPMALDETLQATNTALGAIAKDETLQATNTALGDIEDDIEAIGTALGTLNTTTGGVAKDVTLGLVNTALGTINTALGQIKNAIDAMAVSNIGNMSALTTTDKSSLVGAVNEVAGNVSDLDADKADKVSSATNGNLAKLDSSGNLADSGIASSTLESITNMYGSKNLFPDFIESQTYKGITWTKNADSSITVNGTASGWSTRAYSGSIKLKAGTYILSSGLSWPDCYNVYAELNYNDGTDHNINTSNAGETTFTLANDTEIPTVQVVIRNNTTVSNITIKPMLRDARISDSTYVPYAMTNRELTEKVLEILQMLN